MRSSVAAVTGWTCPECGVDYGTITPANLADLLHADLIGYHGLMEGESVDRLWRRPADDVWSAVEYTMHTADLIGGMRDVVLAMVEGAPVPEIWDPDARAAEQRYNDVQPAEALRRLDAAVAAATEAWAAIDGDGWARTASFPWGERDALTMAQNAVHESSHHLMDAKRSVAAAAETAAAAEAAETGDSAGPGETR